MTVATPANTQAPYIPGPNGPISKLHDDALIEIFRRLPKGDLDSTTRTCKTWQFSTVASVKVKTEYFLTISIEHLEESYIETTDLEEFEELCPKELKELVLEKLKHLKAEDSLIIR